MISDVLKTISNALASGLPTTYKAHPLAKYIREDAKKTIELLLPPHLTDYKVEGSAGRGRWADIPWVAIYNCAITERASQGYYLVYPLPPSTKKVIFGLAQSFQEAEKEFGKHANENLDKQAEIMRMKVPEFAKYFSSLVPQIEVKGRLNYRNGHVYHIEYDVTQLPAEEVLREDFHRMLQAYETLFFRGGRDSDNFNISEQNDKEVAINEAYKKKVHYLIERPSSSEIKKIKQRLGYTCSACGFNFQKVYGDLGRGYIEAHHLMPIADLKLGESRTVTEKDFAVLCSNCHRMIHRFEDSSDLERLRKLIHGDP